jgi:hypothetical protein
VDNEQVQDQKTTHDPVQDLHKTETKQKAGLVFDTIPLNRFIACSQGTPVRSNISVLPDLNTLPERKPERGDLVAAEKKRKTFICVYNYTT